MEHFHDYIHTIIDNPSMPFLSAIGMAFILGLMTTISPCPFCSNLTAIGFIGKDISSKSKVLFNGFCYVVGKVVAYLVLSLVFIFGAQIEGVQHFFETYGEPALGPFLLLCGLFMLIGGRHESHHSHHHDEHHHENHHRLSEWAERISHKEHRVPQWVWAFFLGIVFSLAFCPYSGILFFGGLMTLTMAQPIAWSWTMPVSFGLGTGIPVIVIAWILSYSVMSIGKLNHNVAKFEVWFRRICAILFIIMGLVLIISLLMGHEHHHHH